MQLILLFRLKYFKWKTELMPVRNFVHIKVSFISKIRCILAHHHFVLFSLSVTLPPSFISFSPFYLILLKFLIRRNHRNKWPSRQYPLIDDSWLCVHINVLAVVLNCHCLIHKVYMTFALLCSENEWIHKSTHTHTSASKSNRKKNPFHFILSKLIVVCATTTSRRRRKKVLQ